MTNGVTNPNKRTLRVILAAAAVLILCGAFCGAAAADNPVTEQELRAAIADSAQSTVTLGADITLTTGTLTISRTVTLDLNGKTLARSSAGATPKFSVITINSGGNLTLTDSSSQGTGKITGGNTDYGGGVFIGGSGIFNLYSGSITGNSAVSDGGCVFIDAFGTINLYSGSITGNIGKYGGGIYVYSTEGVFNLMGGEPVIRGNTMKTDIEVSKNNIRLYDSDTIRLNGQLTGNADVRITYPYPKEGTIFGSVGTGGGGVFIYSGTFNIYSGYIAGNVAREKYGGGGVFVDGTSAKFTMTGGHIVGNLAEDDGGGVYVRKGGTFTMTGGDITGNSANEEYYKPTDEVVSEGGGVYLDDSNSTFVMDGGTIKGNCAGSDGGGVRIYDGATFTMNSGTITSNDGILGGGVDISHGATFIMNGGSITSNSVKPDPSPYVLSNSGGGVCV